MRAARCHEKFEGSPEESKPVPGTQKKHVSRVTRQSEKISAYGKHDGCDYCNTNVQRQAISASPSSGIRRYSLKPSRVENAASSVQETFSAHHNVDQACRER